MAYQGSLSSPMNFDQSVADSKAQRDTKVNSCQRSSKSKGFYLFGIRRVNEFGFQQSKRQIAIEQLISGICEENWIEFLSC